MKKTRQLLTDAACMHQQSIRPQALLYLIEGPMLEFKQLMEVRMNKGTPGRGEIRKHLNHYIIKPGFLSLCVIGHYKLGQGIKNFITQQLIKIVRVPSSIISGLVGIY